MATILMDSNELGLRRVVSKFVRVVMMERRCFGEFPTVAGPNGIDPMSVYSAGSEINSCSCLVRCLIGLALLFLVKCSSLKFERATRRRCEGMEVGFSYRSLGFGGRAHVLVYNASQYLSDFKVSHLLKLT
uniref:Uncharacterized protein n=1 Tax=Brassica oleracea TaxID=3712 RepID=A0A3P6DTH0_BRAOL|nr:unnamed protein product [Brassica oleracea]